MAQCNECAQLCTTLTVQIGTVTNCVQSGQVVQILNSHLSFDQDSVRKQL